MGKTLNVHQLSQKKYTLVEGLSDEIKEAIGEIEDTFTCIIYGESGHGKTNITIQLLKQLKSLGPMLYVSFEEGHGKTIRDLIERHNLLTELPALSFSDGETCEELTKKLKRRFSAKVVVIDSWQFSEYTLEDYKALKKQFVFGKTPSRRKIFIFIVHVKGKSPDGKSAVEVKRDCNIKIFVEGFIGDITSRFGSNRNWCIYEEAARAYWGEKFQRKILKGRKPTRKPKTKKQDGNSTASND